MKALSRLIVLVVLALGMGAAPSFAQVMLGMGDSIGEGVQSGDANVTTQPSSYLNWIARKIGVEFQLPLIQSGPFGVVGDTSSRSRVSSSTVTANLAISGADVRDILFTRADAASVAEINSETDLVLFPQLGSQIELAESIEPPLIVCWIGNNDVLSAVTAFDQLDASQMTPVAEFESLFLELTERLGALNSAVIFANIPDVTSIALLLDGTDLQRMLGSDLGLPPGEFTTVPAMLLIGLGVEDGTLIQNPNYVLDAAEVDAINARVATFNGIISAAAADIGAPVLDVNQIFKSLSTNPPVLNGTPLTRRFLGGLFSLDGVHPSNIAHALIADQILALLNAAFGANVPRITSQELEQTIVQDPFWDKDLDGQAVGRPFTSLLETIAFVLGFTGDSNDMDPSSAFTQVAGSQLREPLLRQMGLNPERPDPAAAASVLKELFTTPER